MGHFWTERRAAQSWQQVRSWDEARPDARALWLLGSIRGYSPLGKFPKLRDLRVWSANPEQLEIIGGLKGLRCLRVDGLRGVTNLGPLAGLCDLLTLRLEGNLRGVSLEPIGQLQALRELSIAELVSSAVNGKFATVLTFAPLAGLLRLKWLQLFGVKPLDGSLAPLASLTGLKELDLPNAFPLEEFARLAARLPKTKGVFQKPLFACKPDDILKCKKCSGANRTVLVGAARRAMVCPVCDAERIDEHVRQYEQLKREFARREHD